METKQNLAILFFRFRRYVDVMDEETIEPSLTPASNKSILISFHLPSNEGRHIWICHIQNSY